MRGLEETYDPEGWTATYVEVPGQDEEMCCLTTFGPSVAVADSAAELGIEGDLARQVDAALDEGLVVLLNPARDGRTDAVLSQQTYREGTEEPVDSSRRTVPAQMLAWDQEADGPAPATSIVPTDAAAALDLDVVVTTARLTGDLDAATATRIKEGVEGAADGTYVYVERGYQRPDEAVVILLVLGALGGVLMLGGTLTATFLALSDARPDLATLSAVGAAPRTRRRVAASSALVVGFVGAVLGAAVGFIPGVAISRPLTSGYGGSGSDGPFLDVPWLLVVAVVLALPLLTAAVVGLSARSRLPLVARLD
jgi:putative ABC transport system permease protein